MLNKEEIVDVVDKMETQNAANQFNFFKTDPDLSFKNIVSSNVGATTFHGVKNIYHTNDLFLKIILAVSFLTASGFLFFFTVNTLVEYFSFNVLSSHTVISDIPTECMFINQSFYL
jgi:hypothetical protein